MGLAALSQAAETIQWMGDALSETEKEYVMQFAFRTGDEELTEKLAEELAQPLTDKEAVCRRFRALEEIPPDWIQKMENLVVSLERYRMQEEKAVKEVAELLSAYGIVLSEKEIRELSTEKLHEFAEKENTMQTEEKERKEERDDYGGRDTGSSSDYPCCL